MQLERLPDHRRLYLNYEGPISGDRGEVTPVAAGLIMNVTASAASVQLDISWAAGVLRPRRGMTGQLLRIERQSDGGWLVRCEKRPDTSE